MKKIAIVLLILGIILVSGVSVYARDERLPSVLTSLDNDGDGIANGLDIYPNGGGHKAHLVYRWEFKNKECEVSFDLSVDQYAWRAQAPISVREKFFWFSDHELLRPVADQLREIARKNDFDEVEFITDFVHQNIFYAHDELAGYDDFWKYPIETMFERSGDCEDKNLLLDALLIALGYDTAIIYVHHVRDVDNLDHVMLAVHVDDPGKGEPYFSIEDKDFFYVDAALGMAYEFPELIKSCEWEKVCGFLIKDQEGNWTTRPYMNLN